jgi:hypothetical protein
MPYLAKVIDNVRNPELVIDAAIEYPPIAMAIFPDDAKFGDAIRGQTGKERTMARINRYLGRRILSENGLVPVGIGSERLVVGDEATERVYKYIRDSSDPEADLKVEKLDYLASLKEFGEEVVVPTEFQIRVLRDKPRLVEPQPWLNLEPILTITAEDPELERQLGDIADGANRLRIERGLFLDGAALMINAETGQPVIHDTSPVDVSKVLGGFTLLEPDTPTVKRPERTWRSLGIPQVA